MIQSSFNFETVSFEEAVDDDVGIDTENPYEHTEEQSPVAKKKLKFVHTSTPISNHFNENFSFITKPYLQAEFMSGFLKMLY